MDILETLSQKLKELNNIGEKVAPKLKPYFDMSVNRALADYYGSYDPKYYRRTNNFMSVTTTTKSVGSGNSVTFTVDSSSMSDYPSMLGNWYEDLYAASGFDFMYMNGEHGHGRFLKATSIPPDFLVAEDVESGFNGEAQRIIEQTVSDILKI